jgi:hypothetical protein
MSSCTTFALQVTLGYGSDTNVEDALTKACAPSLQVASTSFASSLASITRTLSTGSINNNSKDKIFVASASHVELSIVEDRQQRKQSTSSSLIAVLVPPDVIDACLEKYNASSVKLHASGSCFWIADSPTTTSIRLAQELLPSIHPALIHCQLRGIVRTSIAAEDNAPAEIVLLELPPSKGDGPSSSSSVADILEATNGQALNGNNHHDAILKVLPISHVHFASASDRGRVASLESQQPLIPLCAVCLHRIDPVRLGLPTPTNDQLCSKFCPPPSLVPVSSCPKQRFLQPWAARCRACRVIQDYWNHHNNNDNYNNHHYQPSITCKTTRRTMEEANDLFCGECAMHKTLWVCLTCGFVGCGRYSNKHSVAHFQETHHPYSLELATLRIWNYVHDYGYAHRVDLLECPSSPPLAHPWMAQSSSTPSSRALAPSSSSYTGSAITSTAMNPPLPTTDDDNDPHQLDNQLDYAFVATEKSPKKATMIGVEYEALLQSALEDQAQHYEGELTHLRAELTASLVDENTNYCWTLQEQAEIKVLQDDICKWRSAIEQASRELLDTQAQEAGHRATSQRLLQEQQHVNTVLQEIQQGARQEAERGKLLVEDLEQQVRDLTANLSMRQQFSQSEELNEAQIFGTSSEAKSSPPKRGKKKGRFFRK